MFYPTPPRARTRPRARSLVLTLALALPMAVGAQDRADDAAIAKIKDEGMKRIGRRSCRGSHCPRRPRRRRSGRCRGKVGPIRGKDATYTRPRGKILARPCVIGRSSVDEGGGGN